MENKTYLVTGASKGIGRAIAKVLASDAIRVVLLSRPSKELEAATDEMKALSPTSFSVECDLASPQSIDSAIDRLEHLDAIDGIVHNAGTIAPIQSMFEAENTDWERNIQVNITGVQRLTKGLYPKMKAAGHCRVTTISSGAALRPLHS